MSDDAEHAQREAYLRVRELRLRRMALHEVRAQLLEDCVVLEQGINEVLAVAAARSVRVAAQLQADVYWRLPIPVRLQLLGDLLDERELTDWFPTLLPVLKRAFDVRHLLAHGLVEMGQDPTTIVVRSVKRGRGNATPLTPTEMNWLDVAAQRAHGHLARVWAAVVPCEEDWHNW